MIFYFSATGNSQHVASQLSEIQQEECINIANCLKIGKFDFNLSENEKIGFVFPVYFFGLPTLLIDFIKKIKLQNYKSNYTFAVCTCGTQSANTLYAFKKLLKKYDIILNSGFTVKLPDNYILLFNLLLPADKREKILQQAEPQIASINKSVLERKNEFSKENVGILPSLVSTVGYPIYSLGRSTKPFHAMDTCTGCSLCEKLCPTSMIYMHNNKPQWKSGKCAQCLACLHLCPTRAIQYGKSTINRDRYKNPKSKLFK